MSYDINLVLPKKTAEHEVQNYVNSLPNVHNLRFGIGETYYMEIDLELRDEDALPEDIAAIDTIALHIPYYYLKGDARSPSIYFEFARQVTAHFHADAIDLQLEMSLFSPDFEDERPS